MAEVLVIRLRAAAEAPASWLVVDASGARAGPVETGPLTGATPHAAGRRCVLLVPGSDVAFAEPELPLRGGARLLKAVPFALEEQLASDVEGLHFAVGARATGSTRTPVAAIAREALAEWLAACAEAGLEPSAVHADSAAVPASPNGCTLLLDSGQLFVHRAGQPPFALDADPLDLALDLALARQVGGDGGEADERPPEDESSTSESALRAGFGEHDTFYADAVDYEAHRDAIEGLRTRTATLQVKLLPDGALPLLAAQAIAEPPISLLQGEFAPRTSLTNRLRDWRLPLALAAATVLLFVLGQGFSLWSLVRAEKQVDAQIAAVFAEVLPGQPVVDPRAQVQGLLGAGRGSTSNLLPALSVLSRAMARTPSGRVEALSFRGDALDLRIAAPTVEAIDGIQQAMTQEGLRVELQSATPRGDEVEGRLQVRLGSA